MKWKVIFLAAILTCFCSCADAFLTESVRLAEGTTITGLRKLGYDSFLGIPFAQPPVGNLRFRNPQPMPLWTGDRKAIVPKLFCWQFDAQFPIPPSGTEDCLYLNVFRPSSATSGSALKVIVFLHGGGFYSGTNNPLLYGPDFIMESGDFILVTVAYRLNVFGFLNTGDLASPGNYGLKDQTMALRWVQQNIAAFGGDPDAVSFMGQSAGSVAISYHLLSRHSEGLYRNAFLISGVIDTPWAQIRRDPREYVNRHARAVGIENPETMSSEELVDRFRELPAKLLTQGVEDLRTWDILPIATYLPTVEPEGAEDPFLSVDPQVALERRDIRNVPIMASIVPGEAINFVQGILRLFGRYEEFNTRIYELMPILLDFRRDHPNMTAIVDRIRFEYLGPTGFVTPDRFDDVLEMASDHFFGRPFYTALQKISRASDAPLYAHSFEYRGLKSFAPVFNRTPRDYGVVHVDDLIYIFRISLFPIQLSPSDKRARDIFLGHVLNFCRTGNPGYDEYDGDNPRMAQFKNSETNVITREETDVERHEFWGEIQEMLRDD